MDKATWWNKLQRLLSRFCKSPQSKRPDLTSDVIRVKLLGLEIQISRELPKNIPYELTVVIPRVEYRLTGNTQETPQAWEVLLNSITVAHSPRL